MKFHAVADAIMNSLAVMNPDGSGIVDLKIHGYDPSVSPDGTRIVCCSLRDDQYSQIYVAKFGWKRRKADHQDYDWGLLRPGLVA